MIFFKVTTGNIHLIFLHELYITIIKKLNPFFHIITGQRRQASDKYIQASSLESLSIYLFTFNPTEWHLKQMVSTVKLPDGIPWKNKIFFEDKGCHFVIHCFSTIHSHGPICWGVGMIQLHKNHGYPLSAKSYRRDRWNKSLMLCRCSQPHP